MVRFVCFFVSLLLAGTCLFAERPAAAAAAGQEPLAIGDRVGDVGALRDTRGNSRQLHDMEGSAIVLLFVGTDCPLANVYLPRILEMEAKYQPQGVQFLAVYPNERETLERIAGHAYDRDIPFPILKDFDQQLADALGVTRTPEVCVLDKDFVLRYRGRIDDQYAVATRKPTVSRHDLIDALESVLAGKDVARPEVPADGCLISRTRPAGRSEKVTFNKDVLPIIQNRCQECHRPGQVGPFSLMTYDDVVGLSEAIEEVVEQRRMPPWHPDPRYGEFSRERKMTDEEVATFLGWIRQGMPEGDVKDAPAPRDWTEGWSMGEPDIVFSMPQVSQVPSDGVLPYRYFYVPTNFEKDRWVKMAEASAGNPSVVHHIIVYFVSPGRARLLRANGETQVLAIGGPGEGAFVAPPGTAVRVPKGSELVFEMHYTPNGIETSDRSSVGIIFADEPPERELRINMLPNFHIRIPPYAQHHREESNFTFEHDGTLVALLPHMHWRGKAFHYEAQFPDGRKETLLSVPRFDFDWQACYYLKEPMQIPAGTTIHSVAHWDNSKNNPANPDPSDEVRFGLQTHEEMMLGWMIYAYDTPFEAELPQGKLNPLAVAAFHTLDFNRNKRIDRREMPPPMRQALSGIGMEFEAGLTLIAFEGLFTEIMQSSSLREIADGLQKKAGD